MNKRTTSSHFKGLPSVLVMFLMVLLCCGSAWAQGELIVYPNKGQSQQEQDKDSYECYAWAKQQSGFDPMTPPTASTPPPQDEPQKGGVVRGAVGGGLAGVAIGAIAGNAGKGAAIGAASGALIGGIRRHDQVSKQEQAEQQWAQQETARYSQGRNNYNRAFSACMEGRNYSVK